MTPTAIVPASSSNYLDGITSGEGYYYYVVIAENFAGQSAISNCLYVEIKFAHLWEYGVISGVIVAAMVVFVGLKTNQNKKKLNEN